VPNLAEYILSFCSPSSDAQQYALTHLGRLVKTLEITPPGSDHDRILEMGAYMQITPALKTRLGYGEVRGCYLGPIGETHEKSVTSTKGETFSCFIDLFNAERDRYPYPDDHFDTVVCCELLEHLAEDPMHMMSEVNRILRQDGHFVLSTPNICALRAVSAVLCDNHPEIYSQYTVREGGNQVAPRHAREYTPREIRQLLEVAGFETKIMDTGPYSLQRPENHDWTIELLQQHGFSTDLRDDVIHAVGKKVGAVRERYPDWLYA
jgi:SAM-dependent methyltransferase